MPFVVVDTSVALPATLSPAGLARKFFVLLAYGAISYEVEHAQLEIDELAKQAEASGGRAKRGYRMFPNVTESLFFFIKDAKPSIRAFLKERQSMLKLSSKEINERLGAKSNGGALTVHKQFRRNKRSYRRVRLRLTICARHYPRTLMRRWMRRLRPPASALPPCRSCGRR